MDTILAIGLSNVLMALLLAVLAATVGRLSRRPALTHLLWVLVLVKLLTPPLRPLELSCPESWARAWGELTGNCPAPVNNNQASEEPSVVAGTVSISELEIPMDEDAARDAPLPAVETTAVSPPIPAPPDPALSVVERFAQWGWETWSWTDEAVAVWLSGSLIWLMVAIVRIRRFQRLLRHGRPAPEILQHQARLLAARLGLPQCPDILLMPGHVSPLLWALGGRARLVLPADLLGRLAPEQQVTLLAHELAHARRRDHWVRWLELAATGLYWWCPVVWWARRRLQEAEEACCDAWVVWALPAAAKAYARTLLQTVEFLDARPALPVAASGLGHIRSLQRRLTMIVRQPVRPQLPWTGLVGAALVGLLVLPIAPQRLQARLILDDPLAASTAEDPPPDPGTADLERRLRALESKMERVINAVDAMKERSSHEAGTAANPVGRGRRDTQTTNPGADSRRPGSAQEEKPRTSGSRIEIRRSGATDAKAVDTERMKDLEKQINDAVHQAVNPERMRDLERQINQAVHQALNPERMRELEKRIQETVNRSISPERMEAMGRKIQQAVERSLSAEQKEKVKALEKLEKKDQGRGSGPATSSATARRGGSTTGPSGRERSDLERRINRLEERMDKVLEALERTNTPGKR